MPAKPASGTSVRNKWAVRGDRQAISLPLNEGVGNPANVGLRTAAPWNAIALTNTPTWAVDAGEGAVLDFDGTNESIDLATAAADITYRRGTILLRCNFDASGGDIFGTGVASGTNGELYLTTSAPGVIQLGHCVSGGPKAFDVEEFLDGVWYTLILTWGERGLGFRAFSPTAELTQVSSATDTTPYVIKSGQTVQVGNSGGANGMDGKISAFCWWDWQIVDEHLVRKIVNDPYIYCRPASADCNNYVYPRAFGATATSVSFRDVVKSGSANTIKLKTELASDQLFQNIVATNTTSAIAAGNNVTTTLTGLTASTRYFARHSYDTNSSGTFLPYPGGVGIVRTVRAAGESFSFGVSGDSHITSTNEGTSTILNGHFEDTKTVGTPYAHGYFVHDVERRGDLDFHINGGDDIYQTGPGAFTAEEMASNYNAISSPLSASGVRFSAIGNHEEEASYKADNDTNGALRQAMCPNPTDGDATYGRYYGFEWGDTAILVLECERNSDDYDANLQKFPVWAFGSAQKSYAQTFFSTTKKQWKIVVIHKNPGGVKGQNVGWYGRGGGVTFSNGRVAMNKTFSNWENAQLYDPAYGFYDPVSLINSVGLVDEAWMFNFCAAYRAIVFMGHDHKFAHFERSGVNVFHWPTTSSQFQFSAATTSGTGSSLYTPGPSANNLIHAYGDWRLKGSDAAGIGIKYLEQGYGYLVVTVNKTTLTVKYRKTFVAQATSAIGTKGYASTIASSGPKYTPSGSTVTLDERPDAVHFIVDENDDNPSNTSATYAANRYDITDDFPDLSASADYETPYGSAVVTFDSAAMTGTKVAVNYCPCDAYTAVIELDESAARRPRAVTRAHRFAPRRQDREP